MFDLRYHVASLTAVLLALVIGILVGVGISGRGFVTDAERRNFNSRLEALDRQLQEEEARAADLEQRQDAAQEFVEGAYPVLANDRLAGKKVAVLVVGSADATLDWVLRAIDESDGQLTRLRVIRAPLRSDEIESILGSRASLGGYVGVEYVEDLGRDLGRELMLGGDTPLWDALSSELVIERAGESTEPADALVVIRPAAPQGGDTARFLAGLYGGIASAGAPVVGAEVSRVLQSAIPVFQRYRMSTVDGIDTPVGRLGLVLLLAGAERGNYGVRDTAEDGILPPIEPLPAETPGD